MGTVAYSKPGAVQSKHLPQYSHASTWKQLVSKMEAKLVSGYAGQKNPQNYMILRIKGLEGYYKDEKDTDISQRKIIIIWAQSPDYVR